MPHPWESQFNPDALLPVAHCQLWEASAPLDAPNHTGPTPIVACRATESRSMAAGAALASLVCNRARDKVAITPPVTVGQWKFRTLASATDNDTPRLQGELCTPTCRVAKSWHPMAWHIDFAVTQLVPGANTGSTFKHALAPSRPSESTHAVHDVSLHASTPYTPLSHSVVVFAHAEHAEIDTLPAGE
jgi:hypothetical protein